MRKKIRLPIFFMNDSTQAKESAGIDYDVSENDIREVIFYDITAIAEYSADTNYSNIYAGGTSFVCAWPVSKVERILESDEGK